MRISAEGIKLIKNFEGLRTKPYKCVGGYRTIGYGHLLSNDDNRESINLEEAEKLLSLDISKAENSVQRNIKIDLTQGQFDALVSFTFNLGSAALQRSTLRHKINRHEHDQVPKEFRRWVYANGIIRAGLVKRRSIEAEIYNFQM
jgi:lysozyme